MNLRAVTALTRKDLLIVLRNPGVLLPLIIAPLLLLVVLPVVIIAGGVGLAEMSPLPGGGGTPFDALAANIASDASGLPPGTSPQGRWTVFVLESFFAPLYLLVPLIVTTVIAADSFAGERERKTLEALLHTSTSDRELVIAKLLAAWVPAMIASAAGFVAYGIVANVLAWPHLGTLFFPTTTWLLLFLWVSPPLAGLALGCMVLVSSRVSRLQSAHQLGSLVVLPMMLLLIGGVTGAAQVSTELLVALGSLLWALAIGMVIIARRYVTRERLASRL